MSKLVYSLIFGAGLAVSGCKVTHHHYHYSKDDHGKKGKPGHHNKGHRKTHGKSPCGGGFPDGYPPVHDLPEGHPPVQGYHHKKGHGHGHKKGHSCGGKKSHGQHGHGAKHGDHGLSKLPPQVGAFHDSFASAWHQESDAAKRQVGCASADDWKRMAGELLSLNPSGDGAGEFSASAKELSKQVDLFALACNKKNTDVIQPMSAAHQALHGIFKSAHQSRF